MVKAAKFWTLQKKILAIALTAIAIGGVWGMVAAGGKAINASMNFNFINRVKAVANSLDSIRCVARTPIDSLILSELKGIRMEQRKVAFILEKSTGQSIWTASEVAWKADSLFNARYPVR